MMCFSSFFAIIWQKMKKNTSWKFTDESSVTFQSSVSGAGEFGLCRLSHNETLLRYGENPFLIKGLRAETNRWFRARVEVCLTLDDLIKISKMSKAKMLIFAAATIAAVRSVTI